MSWPLGRIVKTMPIGSVDSSVHYCPRPCGLDRLRTQLYIVHIVHMIRNGAMMIVECMKHEIHDHFA